MNDIMKIFQVLEDSNILLKGITKTIENKTKEQKEIFLGMLLGTLGASLLGNMLTGKGMLRACYENKERKQLLRAGYKFSIKKRIQFHPILWQTLKYRSIIKTNLDSMEFVLEIIWLNKIKDRAYVVILLICRCWYALNCFVCKNIEIIYFDCFGAQHISKKIRNFIGHKNKKTNMFKVQAAIQ